MDPKSIANLDPKLRETYERVMGSSGPVAPAAPLAPSADGGVSASIADASTSISPGFPPVQPESSVTPPPPDLSVPVSPEPQLSNALSSTQPVNPNIPASTPYTPADLGLSGASQPTPAAEMQPLASPATVAQTAQGSSSLIKILYIFGGIVFFVVYVFFWVRIFNYQLPF